MGGFVCSFSSGTYRVKSPTGKTSLLFDESEYFGPSKVHPRTGDLSLINERLTWFWDWYPSWREAGRPTIAPTLDSPIGEIRTALGPNHYERRFKEAQPLPTHYGKGG